MLRRKPSGASMQYLGWIRRFWRQSIFSAGFVVRSGQRRHGRFAGAPVASLAGSCGQTSFRIDQLISHCDPVHAFVFLNAGRLPSPEANSDHFAPGEADCDLQFCSLTFLRRHAADAPAAPSSSPLLRDAPRGTRTWREPHRPPSAVSRRNGCQTEAFPQLRDAIT